jgi:O-antigen/teichoic acid export membrane protein
MSAPVGSAERIARNAGLKVLVQTTRLASLVLVIVMARVLGPAEFGKFTLAYTLATLLGVALEFGVSPVLTRGVARDPAATAAQWASAATLKLGLLGLLGPVFLALPLLAHRPWDTTAAVWLLGLALALQSFVENGVSVFTGVQRLDHELRVRLVEKSVLVVAGFAALGLGGGLLGVVCAFVLAAAVSLGLTTWLIHRRLARLDRWWDAPGAWALARELAPVAQALVFAFATSRLAPIAVALLAGDVAAGHFGAAFRVYDVMSIVPVTLIAAVYPELARTPSTAPRFRALTTQAVEALLLLAWPVALGLLVSAPWLIGWIYGPRYLAAAPVLALLGAAVGCAMVQHFCGVVFLALDQPRRLRVVAVLAFGTSAVVTPSLVLAGGAVGAALAVLIVELVGLAASLWSFRQLGTWPLGRGAAKSLGAAVAGAAAASLWPAGGPGRLLVALGGYAVALLVLRPVPGSVCRRLLRGALGRPAPPSIGEAG